MFINKWRKIKTLSRLAYVSLGFSLINVSACEFSAHFPYSYSAQKRKNENNKQSAKIHISSDRLFSVFAHFEWFIIHKSADMKFSVESFTTNIDNQLVWTRLISVSTGSYSSNKTFHSISWDFDLCIKSL